MSEQTTQKRYPTRRKRLTFHAVKLDFYNFGAKVNLDESWMSITLYVWKHTLIWEYDLRQRRVK